jgi:S-adenosylmethionine synthetase
VDLIIDTAGSVSPRALEVEVVERKGIGHPDTICDALAESISVQLCRYYLARFGTILHHNVDKILLCGGTARAAFGGGEVLEPLELYLAGRATGEYQGERIPVAEIATEACRAWIRSHLPALDVDRHVKIVSRIRPGSGDLIRIYSKGHESTPLSNDTSCGAGFAPLTPLENIVLTVEHALNSTETKRAHPAIGHDIKVMGVRQGSRISLTIGCAMIGRYLSGIEDYLQAKIAARQVALEAARGKTDLEIDAVVNAADDLEQRDVFLTVTGTSAEAGDDGEVGRGNRTSGLITPYRPMTLEAAAGKNPVSHVGKLYNLAATEIASRAVREVPYVTEASCVLVSRIGRPIDDPQVIDLRIAMESGRERDSPRKLLRDLVETQLRRFPELQTALLEGRVPVY